VTLTGDVERDTVNLRKEAGTGADAYLDFSPPLAVGATHPRACIGALRKGGTAVLMGGVTEDIALNYAQLMLGSITVRGNFMYPASGPAQLSKLVEGGLIDLKSMNTMEVAFEDLLDGITSAEKHAGAAELVVLRVSSQK
jgi:threonine dehydrogenase-like Zn-dependent dehydrogenase